MYPISPYQQNIKVNGKNKLFSPTFLKIASQGLPDGQDGQAGAGSISHTDPDGLDQYQIQLKCSL